jgi:hypothetical protein
MTGGSGGARGLIPRTVEHVFATTIKQTELNPNKKFSFMCSFMEVCAFDFVCVYGLSFSDFDS